MDVILDIARTLVREGKFVWETYDPGRLSKLSSMIDALSVCRGSSLPEFKLDDSGFQKIYRVVLTFETHIMYYLLPELLYSIKLIPDKVYQKMITPVRIYLNLLITLRDGKKIGDIPDNCPIMMYWDCFNKRLWKIVISKETLDNFKIQTLIENNKDMKDAILNLQNNRLFFGVTIPPKVRMSIYKKEVEALGKGCKNTQFYKITYDSSRVK